MRRETLKNPTASKRKLQTSIGFFEEKKSPQKMVPDWLKAPCYLVTIRNREALKSTLKIFLFNLSLPEEDKNIQRPKTKLQITSFLSKYPITNS